MRRAADEANSSGPRSVVAVPGGNDSDNDESSRRHSAGPMRTSSAASSSLPCTSVASNSPVLTSTYARPKPAPSRTRLARKLLREPGQQVRFEQHAGREHAHDVARHQAVPADHADLLGDGDVEALGDQSADVALGRMGGNAGHRDAFAATHLTRGERNVERFRGDVRVVFERFVKVAQTEEQDGIRLARLQLEELPTNRRKTRVLHPGQREGAGAREWNA